MKYALSQGIVIRKEWFGCLIFQSCNGQYWQFNSDAYEILLKLTRALTIEELKIALFLDGFEIGIEELQRFISLYEEQGLISQREESLGVLSFYEDKTSFRTDCLVAPSSVTLYVTDYCPKNCRHCATNSHKGVDMQTEFTLADWELVLQKLRQAGVFMLIISGGEPLVVPHIFSILKMADEMQFGLTLLTDFDGITEKQIAELKLLKHLVGIQTSLDGATAKTHNFLRGSGSFQKTLRRLQLFKKAGLVFTVSTTVHKKNIDELDKIANSAYVQGASFIYFNAIAPYGRAKKTMQKFLLEKEELKRLAQICLRLTDSGKIKTRNPFWEEELKHLGDQDYDPLSGTLFAMSLGIYNFTISAKGDCHLDSKQRAEKLLKLGNIKTDNLHTMWNNPRLDKIRSLFSSRPYALAPQSEIEKELMSV